MSDFSIQLAQASDPETPAAILQQLATTNPDLWVAIAQNPRTYPALLHWLDQRGVPEVSTAVRLRQTEAEAQTQASDQPAIQAKTVFVIVTMTAFVSLCLAGYVVINALLS